MTDQNTIDTYNRAARALAAKFAGIGARTEDIDLVFDLVSEADPRVLEIGCGDGRDAIEITKRTNNYTGLDISSEMLRIAQERLPNADFVCSDILDYEFPQGLHAIFAFASLLHLPKDDVAYVLARSHKALAQHGILYLSLKHADKYEVAVQHDEFGERTFYYYSDKDIESMNSGLFDMVRLDIKMHAGRSWIYLTLKKR